MFADEAGGHRWQRVPPSEKRGRIHTSTVTVAVLDPEEPGEAALCERDIEMRFITGSGPGGQHRNKTASCVTLRHRPTGVTVRIDGRFQHQNRAVALRLLAERVSEQVRAARDRERNATRRDAVGSGMRGDKRRTYRQQDDRVTDHVSGRSWKLRQWLRGDWR